MIETSYRQQVTTNSKSILVRRAGCIVDLIQSTQAVRSDPFTAIF